jgi:hypothetical protein
MSRKYKFKNPEGVYFVSFSVVNWIDALTRSKYAGENGMLDILIIESWYGQMY